MPTRVAISPNEPDAVPDYVDSPAGRKDGGAAADMASPCTSAPGDHPDGKLGTEGRPGQFTGTGSRPGAGPEGSVHHRDGECVPNVPDAPPAMVDESAVLRRPPPSGDAAAPARPSPFLRWHLLILVLLVAALGVLVFGQVIASLAMAATLPTWAQYLLLVPLGLCCLAVAVVCLELLRSWFRLRAVRQVDLAALEELRRRAKTRQDGVDHLHKARGELEEYLRRYAFNGDGEGRLRAAGLKEEEVRLLAGNRDRLLGLETDSRSWLEDFRRDFQGSLDGAASARIRSWALKAAGCVVASPLPLLDAILVLGISIRMIGDLCTLYNVRSSRAGAVVLLNRAIVAAFIAGVAENATEMAGEELAGMATESTLGAMGARVAGIVGPKVGEGAINAFFIHRLGRATVAMLQPLRSRS